LNYQFVKAKAVATLIGAYRSNGADILEKGGRPVVELDRKERFADSRHAGTVFAPDPQERALIVSLGLFP
jgi:hypothetical protein